MASDIFSAEGYRSLLTLINRCGYNSILVPELDTGKSGQIIMRHDIDFCMDYARDMAALEASEGIRATYYVMLRSPMYNLFARHESSLLNEIVSLGHDIGVHYDARWTEMCDGDHADGIRFEAGVLGKMCGAEIRSFSVHQPDSRVAAAEIEVEGFVNLYDEKYFRGFEYISDSNRDWRGKDIEKSIEQRGNLQFLTHPMWWICEEKTTEDCWDRTIEFNFQNAQRQILETERAYGPARKLVLEREGASGTLGSE